jgi:type I restriction-modification system DNA methylase subunit
MSEELIQKDLIKNPAKIGKWDFYNIGATTIKQLKENGIIRNVDYGKEEKKKVDALIVQKKNVIAVIEYKKPSEFNTKAKKQKAVKQELTVAQKLKAYILIATDSKESIWINVSTGKEIKDENAKPLKYNFDFNDERLPELIEKIINSINEKNNQIKPKKLVNPTDLAKQIWQDIWSVSGATPENCLYTFVELFIFKYLSDLGVLKTVNSFDFLIKMYDETPPNEVLEYYASNIRKKIKELFPKNDIDNTTIINGTIFVSKDQKAVAGYSTVFKKVLLKFKNYGKLEHIDYDFKSQLFESFLKESISKKNWGQFFTPLKVVRAIVEMTKDDIKDGVSICDPACGVGKFLLEPIKTKLDQFYKIQKNSIKPKITIHGFDKGFDKDEQKTIILAKANMLIYFSDLIKDNPGLTKDFAQLFNDSFTLKTNSILGTLADPVQEKYDLILTNPPYVTSGSSNLKEEIKKVAELENYYKVNAMGVEGLFMEWIVRALKPNGKAFIVVPDGIFNRQNDAKLRKFLLDECFIDAIISLPEKTFFTTPKKTYILALTKKVDRKVEQIDPVFTYLVSEIGETRDVYRFDIEQNDLQEAVTLFSFFKGNKSSFDKINTDKRCKIQPISKFQPDEHWSIDRWWTKEEKIELGIEEEDNIITTEEFSELIKDISSTLEEFSEIAKEVSVKKKETTELKEVSLNDKSYFELSIGKRIVKKDIVKFSGNIPIYSANVFKPVGFSDKSNITNFDNNFVLWGIDGDFEFNAIPKNTPFISTDHCGVIRILSDSILPKYLMIQLENVKHIYGFDRGLRASLKNMSKVKISIPMDENGNIDIKKQKEIIDRYNAVQEIKKQVREYREKIKEIKVEIRDNYQYKSVKIKDICNFPTTNSKITKEFCLKHQGSIPVYASSKNERSVLGHIVDNLENVHYYSNCLSWNRNGSVGYVFIRKGKFATNEDHRAMLVRNEYNKQISKLYLKYEIEKQLLISGFSFLNKCGVDKIKKINIEIPIKPNGKFDLKAQKEIANKYEKIEEIKTIIDVELKKIEKTKIDYE